MEASALKHSGPLGLRGPSPLLRLQSDERLVAMARRGNQAAFEALVGRYQARLLAFCRHMLSSKEDAEDVLQEVFAASFNAMMADERPINVRPWLYRIARNRSLNHLRRQQAVGQDSMDIHLADGGTTTADRVHKREEFRQLVADVQELPETQRTALLLREIDALSYEQIAEAMETTVPSVKSLLVRARVSLAEAAEARHLTCDEVREELGEVAEGIKRTSAPARRHLRQCERCGHFRKQLRTTNRQLAALLPVAPLLLIKKIALAQLGTTASAGGAAAAASTAATTAAAGTASIGAGIGAVASKTAAGLAAAAIVTAGAVEVKQVRERGDSAKATAAASAPAAPAPEPAPVIVSPAPPPKALPKPPPAPAAVAAGAGEDALDAKAQDEEKQAEEEKKADKAAEDAAKAEEAATATQPATTPAPAPQPKPATTTPQQQPEPALPTQEESESVTLPGAEGEAGEPAAGEEQGTDDPAAGDGTTSGTQPDAGDEPGRTAPAEEQPADGEASTTSTTPQPPPEQDPAAQPAS